MSNENRITHESFGTVQVSHYSGGQQNFFGSDVQHRGGIELKISTAELCREHNNDYIFSKDPIITVRLSEIQYASMISSPNRGSGVPCTITWTKEKGRIEATPVINKHKMFDDEFNKDCENIGSNCDQSIEMLKKVLEGKTVSKSDIKDILSTVVKLKQDISSNIPFLKKQYKEAVEKMSTEAEAGIEAYWYNKLTQLGLDSIKHDNMIEQKD